MIDPLDHAQAFLARAAQSAVVVVLKTHRDAGLRRLFGDPADAGGGAGEGRGAAGFVGRRAGEYA